MGVATELPFYELGTFGGSAQTPDLPVVGGRSIAPVIDPRRCGAGVALPEPAIARLRLGIASHYRERVVDEATIDEAARRIADACPPGTRVILFGSHARGEAGKHSDLDFLVIEPEVENVTEESVRLRRTLRGLLFAADVIVASERRVSDWHDVKGSLIHAALTEGRELAV
jgi:predicted nucleotidyltransferase